MISGVTGNDVTASHLFWMAGKGFTCNLRWKSRSMPRYLNGFITRPQCKDGSPRAQHSHCETSGSVGRWNVFKFHDFLFCSWLVNNHIISEFLWCGRKWRDPERKRLLEARKQNAIQIHVQRFKAFPTCPKQQIIMAWTEMMTPFPRRGRDDIVWFCGHSLRHSGIRPCTLIVGIGPCTLILVWFHCSVSATKEKELQKFAYTTLP